MSEPVLQPRDIPLRSRASRSVEEDVAERALELLARRDADRRAHALGTAKAAERLAPAVAAAFRRKGFLVGVSRLTDCDPGDGGRCFCIGSWRLTARDHPALEQMPTPASRPAAAPPEPAAAEPARRARLAGIIHDVRRDGTGEPADFPLDDLERAHPGNLHHGPLAAQWALDHGLEDAETLFAVRYHTIGHFLPTPLLCALMLADAVEETRDYPGVEELRAAAAEDPLTALLVRLRQTTGYVRRRGGRVHPHALSQIELLERLCR